MVRGIPREVLRGVSVPRRARRGLRPGRRVRLRQVDHRLRRAALPAGQRPHHRRARPGRRRRRHGDVDARAAPFRARARVDGVPGPGYGPEPDAAHRRRRSSSASRSSGRTRARGRAACRWTRCAWSASPTPRRSWSATPTSCRAACSSGSSSPWPWPAIPQLLVLDEPTTGLDATVEAEVLDLVRALRHETDAAILLIAHNLGVIRSMCDRVGVMYAGKIVEEGRRERGVRRPKHPYTVGLLQLPAPPRGAQGPSEPCSPSPATCPRSGPRCRPASSSIAARWPTRPAAPRSRRKVAIGEGHFTRCHHVDRIDEIPEPPADGVRTPSSTGTRSC